jgi:hypothetical protein
VAAAEGMSMWYAAEYLQYTVAAAGMSMWYVVAEWPLKSYLGR